MPRNFFSSSQFQRKRKSLVFFQSINFLCCKDTVKYVENTIRVRNNSVNKAYKLIGINIHKYKNISKKINDTKVKGNKHNWKQIIRGRNVQCIVKVYKNIVCNAVRVNMIETRANTVQNAQVCGCTECVQMYTVK